MKLYTNEIHLTSIELEDGMRAFEVSLTERCVFRTRVLKLCNTAAMIWEDEKNILVLAEGNCDMLEYDTALHVIKGVEKNAIN